VPRTSALQHAAQLSAVERSYVAKYPGDSGVSIKGICEELLERLTAAQAAGPTVSAPAPTIVQSEASS
jgi:hypothetical protein